MNNTRQKIRAIRISPKCSVESSAEPNTKIPNPHSAVIPLINFSIAYSPFKNFVRSLTLISYVHWECFSSGGYALPNVHIPLRSLSLTIRAGHPIIFAAALAEMICFIVLFRIRQGMLLSISPLPSATNQYQNRLRQRLSEQRPSLP